ncbi:MAG TPA: hypothetical protein VLJ37_12560, partial [bacterium]|nr:hypothetical protein [bacterium]
GSEAKQLGVTAGVMDSFLLFAWPPYRRKVSGVVARSDSQSLFMRMDREAEAGTLLFGLMI